MHSVGARRLPVGPNIAATAVFVTDLSTANSSSFFPLATISLVAALSSFRASVSDNFLLAETRSLTSMLLASKNLDAFTQLVQPFLW